ncbi:drug/metabolite transporter (DMT)-like permease [Sporosarcina luteola]|nr:drug/metabolite transporter (DMT)-like permease [Sporosarcina luteola]
MTTVLFQAALIISILLFFFGLLTRQKPALLLSAISFLPISYYFWGAGNAFKLIALLPIVSLLVAFLMYQKERSVVR